MKIIIISFLCLLIVSTCNAEITKGITQVYLKQGGDISFILSDNVKIECGEITGKWQAVVIYLPSKKEYFDGVIKVRKGDSLYDSSGNKLGYVVSDKIDAMPLHNTASNSYLLRFSGYILTTNTRPTSIIENELSELVISNKKKLNYNVFRKFITDYGLTKYSDEIDKLYSPNISYVVWYDSYIGGPSVFRLQLIFNHDKLVAIFHGNNLKKTGFPEIKTTNNNLLWLKNSNLLEMRKFAKDYDRLRESDDDADNAE